MPRTKILPRSYTQSENIPPSTTQASTRKKTRVPPSVRVREQKLRETTQQATRSPVSARQREAARRRDELLADSSADEERRTPSGRASTLADSTASDEVKEISILDVDSDDAGDYVGNASQPTLSTRAAIRHEAQASKNASGELGTALPSAITMMAGMIWHAIDNADWARLGHLVESMYEQKFRLDAPELASSTAIQGVIKDAPLALLSAIDDMTESDDRDKWLLALHLVNLGCDPATTDRAGNSVLDLLRQKADRELIDQVTSERPYIKRWLGEA